MLEQGLEYLGLFTPHYTFKHNTSRAAEKPQGQSCCLETKPGAAIAPDAQDRPTPCCSVPNLWHFIL